MKTTAVRLYGKNDLRMETFELPAIQDDLGTGLSGMQWIVNGYMVTLSSLILLSGSLSDRYGRVRLFMVGVAVFALASALCTFAPTLGLLVAGRIVQGVGGAMLTPGSLAILQASFRAEDRARAIGAWSGLTGVASAVGPFVGGWLVQIGDWRLIFVINLPLAVVVLLIAWFKVPESRDAAAARRIDHWGALFGVVSLGGITYALIQWGAVGGYTRCVDGCCRGGGRPGPVPGGGVVRFGPDAAFGDLCRAGLQRHQFRHRVDLRITRSLAVPAGDLLAGGWWSFPDRCRCGLAADHDPDAAALGTFG